MQKVDKFIPCANITRFLNTLILIDSASDLDIEDEDDLQIPLARNGDALHAELLVVLPPGRHCDTLKEMYFLVVSPVGCLHAPCSFAKKWNKKALLRY